MTHSRNVVNVETSLASDCALSIMSVNSMISACGPENARLCHATVSTVGTGGNWPCFIAYRNGKNSGKLCTEDKATP